MMLATFAAATTDPDPWVIARVIAIAIVGLCGGIVVIAAAAAIVWRVIKPGVLGYLRREVTEPLHETRKQVTENHHSNDRPTVLDRIDDLYQAVLNLTRRLDDHLVVADKDSATLAALKTKLENL